MVVMVVTVTRMNPLRTVAPSARTIRVTLSRWVVEAAMSVSTCGPHIDARRGDSEVGADVPSTPPLLRKCIIFALRMRITLVITLKYIGENFFHTSGQIAGLRRAPFALTVSGKSPNRLRARRLSGSGFVPGRV